LQLIEILSSDKGINPNSINDITFSTLLNPTDL